MPLPVHRPAAPSAPASLPVEQSRGYAMLSKLSGPLGAAADMAQPVEARTLGDSKAGLGSRDAIDGQSFAAERSSGSGSHFEQQRRRWATFQNK